MRKSWSDKDIRLLKKLKEKRIPSKEIARKFGVSVNAVEMKIKKLAKKGRIKTRNWVHDNNYTFDRLKREDLLKGLLIWWCEGTKPSKSNTSVEFVNSDPVLVWHFLNFLRKLNINEKKIRLKLKINSNEEKKAKKFWCDILELPITAFNKSSPLSGKGISKRRLKYGTLTLKYSSKKLLLDLVDKWKGLMEKDLPNNMEEDKYKVNLG